VIDQENKYNKGRDHLKKLHLQLKQQKEFQIHDQKYGDPTVQTPNFKNNSDSPQRFKKKVKPTLHREESPKFKKKVMTFDDLHKMDYKPFTGKGSKHDFNPGDYIDIHDEPDSDHEVLSRYKKNQTFLKQLNSG